MKYWVMAACVWLGAALGVVSPVRADSSAAKLTPVGEHLVVEVKPDRIVLMEIQQSGKRLVAVGERGFALLSDDGGQHWKAVSTPVTRTLTGVAFRDDKVGVAVGHGGKMVRTENGGDSWSEVKVSEIGVESFLGVTYLGGDHFIAYGAFGNYFDSADAGRTWTKRMVVGDDFDRHISQVVRVDDSLLMVAESGTIARSEDDGTTWETIDSPYQGSFFGALRLKDGALLIYGMRGNVYRSADAGETWTKVPIDTTSSLMGGVQFADGRVLLVGNSGLLAVSHDDGQTLELHWSPDGQGFSSAVEAAGNVILVGETGVTKLDPAWLADRKSAAR